MKKYLISLVLLICCLTISAQHLKELTETEKKRQVEEYMKRMADLNSGKYFPNKLISEYIGDWESQDKKIKLNISTQKKKVVSNIMREINAEFDALIIKITYLNNRDTIYTEADLGGPIELVNYTSNGTYSGLVKDAIKDRSLRIVIRYIDTGLLSVQFRLIDRIHKGYLPHPTIFPLRLFNVVKVKK